MESKNAFMYKVADFELCPLNENKLNKIFRAYMELLHNLVDMEGSKNSDIKEAGRILKSSVFYEPEYRELCLQQLSLFNPDRMSIG